MGTFVLVHGAWGGGWIWGRVGTILREAGHKVFAPTLTGLGERIHLATPAVGLDTHIEDIVRVIEYEDLNRIVLVGSSYGGMVITGVAERIPQKIWHLVYVDAFVPQNGQSAFHLAGPQIRAHIEQLAREKGDGWRAPLPFPLADLGLTVEVDLRWCTHRFTPMPLKPFTDPIATGDPAAAALPRTFVYCSKPAMGLFEAPAQEARANPRWQCHDLATGHLPMVTAPKDLAALLLPLAPRLHAPS